jgi:hypothetical protein
MLDTDPMHVRHRTVRETLRAAEDLAHVVAAHCSHEQASELLTAYDQIRNASNKARQAIFFDFRTAIILEREGARASLEIWSGDEGAVELTIHAFRLFVLSVCILEERNCRFSAQAFKPGQFALPGTLHKVHIPSGIEDLEIVGTSPSSLRAAGDIIPLVDIQHVDGFQLAISEELLAPPEGTGITSVVPTGSDERDWINVLGQAYSILSKNPTALNLVRSFGRLVAPVRSEGVDIHCSVSFSARPGVLYMSWSPNPLIIAEGMVHEADHQFYDEITRGLILWSDPLEAQASKYFSPWREDPRPLDGLLTGASAFIRVAELWQRILDSDPQHPDGDFIGQRCALTVLQSLDAISTIKGSARPTETGAEIIGNLERRGKAVVKIIESHPSFARWARIASDVQNEHKGNWTTRNSSAIQVATAG